MKDNKGFITKIFEVSKNEKTNLVLSIIVYTLGMLCSLIPYLSVYFIAKDFLQGQGNDVVVVRWALVAGVSIIGDVLFTFLGSLGCHVVAFNALLDYRLKVTAHLGKLSIGFFATQQTGSIQKTMNENIEKIEGFIAHMLPDLVASSIMVVIMFLAIAYLNIFLAITVVISIFIAFLFQTLVFGSKRSKQLWADIVISSQKETGAFAELVRGISEVKLFGGTGKILKSLHAHILGKYSWERRSYLKSAFPMSVYKSVALSLLSFVLPVGTLLMTIDPNPEVILAVLMTLIIVPAIYDPLILSVNYATQMGMLQAGMGQIDNIMNVPVMKDAIDTADVSDYSIKFNNVNFSYAEEADVLAENAISDISFDVNQGEVLALTGESGSGKSTIVQLLTRFWDTSEGDIYIGGVNIKNIEIKKLMTLIAPVFQDVFIFTDSIYANISMNLPYAKEDVISAAKKAQCHDFIEALPDGYNTIIGSGQMKLSGGEAQRISIARALLKDAPIILLDEALAYTDAENENLIHEAIKNLVKDKTVVIIAHKLRSIKDADKILVLKDGKIIESGKHDYLLSLNGEYTELWKLQETLDEWVIERACDEKNN